MESAEPQSAAAPRSWAPLALALRAYLGVLFVWAGVDKFGDHAFLNTGIVGGSFIPGSLAGVVDASKANNPPFEFALNLIDSQIVAAGVGVALAEIVIGLAILLGVRTRWAALAGAAIMGSFVLTVNWVSSGNWYENVNIAVMFAFLGLAAMPESKWSLDARQTPASSSSSERRNVLRQGLIAAAVIAGSGLLAAVARILGRPDAGSTSDNANSAPTAAGTTLTTLTQIKQDGVVAINLGSNKSGWATTADNGDVVVWSNICTHNGCKVNYAPNANGLACPCHGGLFDPKTGQPLRGPATRGLPAIDVTVDADGNVRSV